MEFSLFNLMTRPSGGPSHAEVMAQMRTMTQIADQGGFAIAWFAEHHLSNYSISPSPLMVAAHMAPLTTNLKVGPAVIVLPFYEPLRLVEDICLADQLCDGRLVLGLGTGYQPREFKKFGFEINDRLQRGLEVWSVIEQGLNGGIIDFRGDHVVIEDAALSVAPVQEQIRTFAVGNAPEVRQRMVETGAIPLMTPALGALSLMTSSRELYRQTRLENGLADEPFEFGAQQYVFVTDSKADAQLVAEQMLMQARMATNMRNSDPVMNGSELELVSFEGEPSIDQIMERAIIGDASDVAARIVREAQEFGITHLSVFMQIAAIPYDKALRSLENFCANVVPDVQRQLSS